MNNKIIISTIVISALTSSAQILAKDGSPTFFGNLNAGLTQIENETDLDGQAFEASVGVKGKFSKEDFSLIYKFEAEFTEATNKADGQSEIEIKNALALLPTSYGKFLIAPRAESGTKREMYKMVDIFEVNETDKSSGLWWQGDEASAVFAYVSPKYNNTHVVASILTLNSPGVDVNNNDENVDAWTFRIVHSGEKLYFGTGLVAVSDKQLPTDKSYYRKSLTAGYKFDNVQLGATWEINDDHPTGDSDVIGVAADIKLNEKWSMGVGYTERDAETDSFDDSATLLIVRKNIMSGVYAYAEAADYDVGNDNYSIGVNIKF